MSGAGDDRHTRVGFRWSIRSKGLVVIALPLIVVLANVILATWYSHVSDRAETSIAGAQAALVDVTGMQSTLLDAQANVAAYLLDHQQAALANYASEMAGLRHELVAVQGAAASAGPAQPAVERTAAVASTLAGDMQKLVQPGTPGSVLARAAAIGRLDTTLTTDISDIRSTVDRLVGNQRGVVHASGAAIVVFDAIAAGAVVIGGAALSLLFTSRVVRRVRRLERATDALARGAPVDDVPQEPDELGRLGTRLVETAALLRRHERALQLSRESLDDILAASPVVSLRYDSRRGVLAYASPNVEAMLGVTATDVTADIGAFLDRLHPDDVSAIDQAVRDAVSGATDGERREHRLRFRRRGEGGAWREARVTTTVVTGSDAADDGHGNVVAYLVDVTERLRAERDADERRNLLESILAASPDRIVVRDAADAIVLSSRHAADPSDGTSAATGRMTVDGRREIADLVRRTRTGEAAPEAVVSTVTTDGRDLRTFETRARPVVADDGRIIGTVTVSRDVTGRVRLEESLRDAMDSAMAASEAKSEFLSRMSHELRTPLNAILGFAQLLALDELQGDQAACVGQIERAGAHLLALINEVLDISRIETGNINLSVEPVSVDGVMREVAALLAPVADAASVHIRLATAETAGILVEADRQRLLQVLINLGSNAVKYNRADGLVALHTAREGGRVTIEVSDTGPGIPPERLPELFVPFARLGAERTGIEGTGVGLALSKHFVELMGGTIEVESEPGRGATFRVVLAAAEAEGAGPGATGAAGADDAAGAPAEAIRALAAQADAPRSGVGAAAGVAAPDDAGTGGAGPVTEVLVLHVEDNESSAALVSQVLARRPDVRLTSVGTARLGWELARRHRPDLILLDIHLPDLPGHELLQHLRADPELGDVTVIAVSADATPTRIRRMRRLGVDAYLTKPIDVGALLGHVDRIARAKRSARAADPGDRRPDPAPAPGPFPEPPAAAGAGRLPGFRSEMP